MPWTSIKRALWYQSTQLRVYVVVNETHYISHYKLIVLVPRYRSRPVFTLACDGLGKAQHGDQQLHTSLHHPSTLVWIVLIEICVHE